MSTCGNCGAKLSCGCQKRTLADGKQGCSNCATKTVAKVKPTVNTPLNNPIADKKVWGPQRYLNLKKFIK